MSSMTKQAEHRWHDERRAEARKVVASASRDVRSLSDLLAAWERNDRSAEGTTFLLGVLAGTAVRWSAEVRTYRADYSQMPGEAPAPAEAPDDAAAESEPAIAGRRQHAHTAADPCPTPSQRKQANAGQFGHAIDGHTEADEDGYFWVGNGEYASRVNYCPDCGQAAPRRAET